MPRLSGGRKKIPLPSHIALIERSNHKHLKRVEVELTITGTSPNRQSWTGEFMSRSVDGIQPNERLSVTFDTGLKGLARVSETRFDSKKPDATMIQFKGTGPLA